LPAATPVLIHGDLWMGNLHASASGELALIDGGAVHYGWAECDLAMLTLFGEPPRAFFAAYEDEAHRDSEWRGRARLLNLYHLLNHLNLFGAGYLCAAPSWPVAATTLCGQPDFECVPSFAGVRVSTSSRKSIACVEPDCPSQNSACSLTLRG
jgi:Fructosamine kinase